MPRIDIYADIPTQELNAVGLAVFKVWSEFAMGQRRLGGRRIKQPTGQYASSLRTQLIGKNHVAVIADEHIAPHARIIETGHRAYDMLDYLQPGKAYKIRRTAFVEGAAAGARFNVNTSTSRRARGAGSGVLRAGKFAPSLMGIVRAPSGRSSVASVRLNTSRTGPAWVVPAMPAYSPTRILMQLFAKRVSSMGGQIGYSL